MSDMVTAGSLPVALAPAGGVRQDTNCISGILRCFYPSPGTLRNGAWPRWRAEETLRNAAHQTNPRFLNARN